MARLILSIVLLLFVYNHVGAQEGQEFWAHEFAPKPEQVMNFKGLGDDVQPLDFIVIYVIRAEAEREPGYWVSEYDIFPEDAADPAFVPSPSFDYYLNEQGLMVRSAYERSQGIMPYLLLPYKFARGDVFTGRGGVELTISNTEQKVVEHGITYTDCVEVTTPEGDQIFFMADNGVVLSRGADERWLIKSSYISEEDLARKYNIR